VTENTIKNFIKLSRDIDDAGNLTDAGQIVAHIGTTKTFNVTVTTKTAAHRYNGSGSGNGYVIDGVEAPHIELLPDVTYRFDQSDSSNSGHPLLFYYEADKTTQYSTGVVTNGTPGSAGAYTEISVTDSTPSALYYQCSAHAYMGNAVSTPPSKNLTVGGDVSDSVSNVRTPRYSQFTSGSAANETIANEGVYNINSAATTTTITLGAPAEGAVMCIYNNKSTSVTLAVGSTVTQMRKGADNNTAHNATLTLGPYSFTTITITVSTRAIVTGTDVT